MTDVDTAERSILGACLIAPTTATPVALADLDRALFANPRLGHLFDVIAAMYGTGTPIDPVTVASALAESPGPAQSMTALDLFALREATPTAANVGYYSRIVRDAAGKRHLDAVGTRTSQLARSDMPLTEAMTLARAEWDALKVDTAAAATTRTLREILDTADPDRDHDWLIPGILERMDRLVLTGAEGAGKSTLLRQVAILAAAGIHPMGGGTIDPLTVLVVDAENTERAWRRETRGLAAKAAHEGQRDPRDHIHLRTVDDMPRGRLNIGSEADLGAVHRLIDRHEPDLLLIGPLYKLIPGAITDDKDAAPLITALDSLRGRGLALLMEAHAGHAVGASGEREMRPRGSAALLGWPEYGFGLLPDRQALVSLPPNTPPTVFSLVRWRGDRDASSRWPRSLIRGGEWPWTDDHPHAVRQGSWSPARHGA